MCRYRDGELRCALRACEAAYNVRAGGGRPGRPRLRRTRDAVFRKFEQYVVSVKSRSRRRTFPRLSPRRNPDTVRPPRFAALSLRFARRHLQGLSEGQVPYLGRACLPKRRLISLGRVSVSATPRPAFGVQMIITAHSH